MKIEAPRNSASDEELEIIELLVPNKAVVREGTPLILLEGAKAIFELHSPGNGVVEFTVQAGEKIEVGEVVAELSPVGVPQFEKLTSANAPRESGTRADSASKTVFTKSARKLMMQHGIDEATFAEEELVTEALVQSHVQSRNAKQETENPAPTPIKFLQMGRLAIVGGGRGAEVLASIAREQGVYEIVGVFDDKANSLGDEGIPLLGAITSSGITDAYSDEKFDGVCIAISSNMRVRSQVMEICRAHGVPMGSLVHPKSLISDGAVIGAGAVILDGARVGFRAELGENVFLSAFVNVEHHCQIGANTTFGPGVFLSGNVIVGENCAFGTGVSVEPNLRLGPNATIASGQIVTHDIGSGVVHKARVR